VETLIRIDHPPSYPRYYPHFFTSNFLYLRTLEARMRWDVDFSD
jgi:hypothetical protein